MPALSGVDQMIKQKVLVIIPAYNEEKTIAGILRDLRQMAPQFDRVVVNDGSSDATGRIIDELKERQIWLPCNVGYGYALQTGLTYALKKQYDLVVTLDADGQHRAEDVPRLVDALLDSGADMIIGSRFCNGRPSGISKGREWGQEFFSWLTRLLTGRKIFDTTSGLKAHSSRAVKAIIGGVFVDAHAETIVRLSRSGYRIEELPVRMNERRFGRSMYSSPISIGYPLKTLLITAISLIDVILEERRIDHTGNSPD